MNTHQFTLHTSFKGLSLTYKTTYGLFAYKNIDEGTTLLLDSITVKNGSTILDLGSGYGAVGIPLAKLSPQGTVYMVDRDFVAVEYSRMNSELNEITNFKTLLSDGFSHLEDVKFDLIVSNLPSHVSHDMLRDLFVDAKNHLNEGGTICVVTVSALRRFISREFETTFGNYQEVAKNKMYTVSAAVNS